MDRNLPANAGDTGSTPGPGRFLMSQSSWVCAPQKIEPTLQGLWDTTTEAHVPTAYAPQQEKPPQWEGHAPEQRVVPAQHD